MKTTARYAGTALTLAAVSLLAAPADAVGTRVFTLDTIDAFKGGDLSGVSIDSRGDVRAGLSLGALPITDASSVWSSVVLGDGTVLLGTGNDGKVFRVAGGRTELAAATGEMAVSAMSLAWGGDVILGTFPEGKLLKFAANTKAGADPKLTTSSLATLPGVEDVWSLAYDAKSKALYAATGPEGKLFRVDQQGKAEVYFDSDEPHLTSVAVADDGTVYAGSNGKALLYKITGPGRASVLHDFDADDVKALAIGKNGELWAVANKYSETFTSPKKNKPGPPGPQPARAGRPGKGLLMRFAKDGVAEPMLDDDDTHYVSLALDDEGAPYVGTGAEGRVYSVDDNHLERLVADTEERQVGALVMAGKKRFLATSDPLVFHEIKGTGGPDAVWTSKVLDAGLRATFGKLGFRADGTVELSTRTGNTLVPDTSWSAWTAGQTAPGEVKSPAARYVQIRARFGRDPKAVLREVTLPFLTDNARAIVTSIEASSRGQSRALKTGITASGGEAPKPSSSIRVSWKVDNIDLDELRFRLSYRLDGQTTWRNALKPGEKLTRTDYEWETSSLPEGTYRLMVEASDELSNPPDRALKHALESAAVLVDNTPPVFKALAMNGRRITGEIVDGLGPIARIEVSIAGSDEWRPIFPKDGIFDEAAEVFDADVATLIPRGSHLVAVRAYDTAGNMVSRDVEAK
jgi:hypothetical protein